MTNKKTTKQQLVASIVLLFMCFSMLLGTTFAWFTDSATSANNKIVAGTLDVQLLMHNGTDYVDISNSNKPIFGEGGLVQEHNHAIGMFWEPGKTQVVYLAVKNNGNLDLKYQIAINVRDTDEDQNLYEALKYAIAEGAAANSVTAWVDAGSKPLNVGNNPASANGVTLKSGEVKYFALSVHMLEEAGNQYMGGSVEFDIKVAATQVASEADSFGTDYDVDADFITEVKTAKDLATALRFGGDVKLANDIKVDETLAVPAGSVVELDLNGKTLTGAMHKNDGAVIKNSGTLTIKNGTISSTAENGGSALANNGTAALDDVTLNGAPNANGSWPSYTVNNTGVMTVEDSKITSYHGAVASYGEGAVVTLYNCELDMSGIPGFTSHGFYTYNNGAIVVNGGTYANNAADQNSTGASVINGAVTVNAGTFSGRIENYSGTPVIKGGTFSVDPTRFVANGFKVLNNNGTYTVIFPQESFDKLIEDAKAGDTVEVPAGEYTFPASDLKEGMTLNCAPGTVFEGNSKLDINGATVVGATFSNPTGTAADQTINGTFKDCTFTGANGLRWCYAGDTVVFENCVFDGSTYGVHFDGGAKEAIFKNCTLSGFNTIAGDVKLVMEGCTFKSNGRSNYNGINLWGNAEMTDCTFVFDGSVDYEWVDLVNNNKTVTFTNCVVTDGKNEKGIETVVGNYGTGNTIVIDGVNFATNNDMLEAAISSGNVDITLAAGEYKMPSSGATGEVNISGTKDTVLDMTMGAYMENAAVTIEGVTIKTCTGMVNGNGSDYAALYTPNVTYKNCTFVGPMRVGRDGAKFINCTFTELGNDYIWTYGNDVTFESCTFNTDGKAILIYSDGGNEIANVTVKNCTFNSTKGAKAGAIANQNCAAIEIHNYGNGVNLVTEGNTYDSNFSGEWRIKTYETGKTKVFVNGTEYTTIAIDGKTMTIDANKNVTVND